MPICLRLLAHWVRLAASRAAWTAGRSRASSTPMMAITTSSSISVKPRRRAGIRWDTSADLSAGPGKRVPLRPPGTWPLSRRSARVPARMLLAEASEQRLDGQVFWLSARNGPRTAFPPFGSGLGLSGGLADHSGGPATDFHRLPYYPPDRFRAGGTCRWHLLEQVLLASVKRGRRPPLWVRLRSGRMEAKVRPQRPNNQHYDGAFGRRVGRGRPHRSKKLY